MLLLARPELAVIEEFADGSLLARARSLGERFQRQACAGRGSIRLSATSQDWEQCRLSSLSTATVRPGGLPPKKLAQHCLRSGVLVLTAGTYDNVIRLLACPLVISDEQFHEALGVMERNLNAVAAELGEMAVISN